ncbi:MAG: hypothetical protein ABIS45_15345 [Burkholderiales bacterium]
MKASKLLVSTLGAAMVVGAIGFSYAQTTNPGTPNTTSKPTNANETPGPMSGPKDSSGMKKSDMGMRKSDTGMNKSDTGMNKTDTGMNKSDSGMNRTDTGMSTSRSSDMPASNMRKERRARAGRG